MTNKKKENKENNDVLKIPIITKRLRSRNIFVGFRNKNNNQENSEEHKDTESENSVSSSSESSVSRETEEEEEYESEIVKEEKAISKYLKTVLVKIKSKIKKKEITLEKILSEPLLFENKLELYELYRIYKEKERYTEEWLEFKNRINILFERYKADYKFSTTFSDTELKKIKRGAEFFNSKKSGNMELSYKILNLQTSDRNKDVIYRKYREFSSLNQRDDEYNKLKNFLYYATEIPHDRVKLFSCNDNNLTRFLKNVSDSLDKALHGMREVKEQILLFLNAKLMNPSMKKCNLGLIGPPGVGKTAIARLISKIMDFPFEQISFGGVTRSEFLKGHDYTYIGSQPGEIVKCLQRMKYKNGIIFLDEYEKISSNKELCAALLHITDPSQNMEFRDNFLSEITIDLSNVWFIYSMNSLPKDSALSDRIFTITIPGYNNTEKISIVKDYLIPKAVENIGLDKNDIWISSDTASYFINKICKKDDKGVRTIEKGITDIVNKLFFVMTHQNDNGLIEDFKISFDIKKKLRYPVEITNELIDKNIKSNTMEIDTFSSMYT